MLRRFLNTKIHRATVTETNLEYEGSLTVDANLLKVAGIEVHEQVDVYNITRGTRFTTYVIPAEPGSGEMCVNGAAAHLAEKDDKIIVVTYCDLEPDEIATHRPKIILVDAHNRPRS